MSKINKPALSLARLARLMKKPGRENKIAVCVGTITNDTRIREFPKMTVCLIEVFINNIIINSSPIFFVYRTLCFYNF